VKARLQGELPSDASERPPITLRGDIGAVPSGRRQSEDKGLLMFQLHARGLRSVTVAGLITGVALVMAGALAAQATAGTYSARFCAAGEGSGDRGPFARSGNESVFTLTDACGNANGLRVSHNGGTPATDGSLGRFLARSEEHTSELQSHA